MCSDTKPVGNVHGSLFIIANKETLMGICRAVSDSGFNNLAQAARSSWKRCLVDRNPNLMIH